MRERGGVKGMEQREEWRRVRWDEAGRGGVGRDEVG